MRYKLILTILLVPLFTIAQKNDGFTADRPGATTGPDVLPKGRLQWETGIGWERSKIESMTVDTWAINTSLLRWGFSETAELRLQANYLHSSVDGESYDGFADVAIGTKMKLLEGKKALPTISMLANVYIPGGSDANYLPEQWGGQIGLLFQNQLTPSISLGYEGDLIWSDDSRPTVFYGICLGIDITDKISIGLEEYNNNFSEGTESWAEISVGWQVAPRIQLDLGTDISLNYPSRYQNLMLGIAWQITK